MVAAPLTDIVPLSFHAVKFTVPLTLRADELSAAVARHHDLMQAGIIRGELLLKLVESHSRSLLFQRDYQIQLSMLRG